MPLLQTFTHPSFDSQEIKLMGDAFDRATALTGLVPLVVRECMASRILEAAHAGERDVERLRDAALDGTGVAPR